MVTLTPIAMRVPSEQFIYAPSRIRPSITVSRRTLNRKYHKKVMRVSFAPDGISNPVETDVYIGYFKYQFPSYFIIQD